MDVTRLVGGVDRGPGYTIGTRRRPSLPRALFIVESRDSRNSSALCLPVHPSQQGL